MKIVLLPGLDGTGMLFKPFIEALPKEIDALIVRLISEFRRRLLSQCFLSR